MSRALRAKNEDLARDLLPLVHKVATKIARRLPLHVGYDDLVGAGMLGLTAALNRFDPRRAHRFSGYAEYRIRGEILDDLRRRDLLSRDARLESKRARQAQDDLNGRLGREALPEEVACCLGLSLEQYAQLQQQMVCTRTVSTEDVEIAQHSPDPVDEIYRKEAKVRLATAIQELPRTQRLVLWLYYYEELPLREIAEVLNVTPSRVCQIRSEAVARLRSMAAVEELAA